MRGPSHLHLAHEAVKGTTCVLPAPLAKPVRGERTLSGHFLDRQAGDIRALQQIKDGLEARSLTSPGLGCGSTPPSSCSTIFRSDSNRLRSTSSASFGTRHKPSRPARHDSSWVSTLPSRCSDKYRLRSAACSGREQPSQSANARPCAKRSARSVSAWSRSQARTYRPARESKCEESQTSLAKAVVPTGARAGGSAVPARIVSSGPEKSSTIARSPKAQPIFATARAARLGVERLTFLGRLDTKRGRLIVRHFHADSCLGRWGRWAKLRRYPQQALPARKPGAVTALRVSSRLPRQ